MQDFQGLVLCKYFPSKEKIEILFESTGINFKMQIGIEFLNFWSVRQLSDGRELFLQFKRPPKFYRQSKDHNPNYIWYMDNEGKNWVRTMNFIRNFSDFLVFESKKIGVKMMVLNSGDYDFIAMLAEKVIFNAEFPQAISAVPDNLLTISEFERFPLSFNTKFMFYSLISLGYISIFDLDLDFLQKLINEDQDYIVESINWIITNNKDFPYETIPDFKNQFLELMKNKYIFTKDKQLRIKRIVITPACYYVLIGEPGNSNRVTRNQEINHENMLRICFADEDLEKLHLYKSPELKEKIRHELSSYQIAGKSFNLLGYSASQLKTGSVWMLSSENHVTPDYIRD